MTLPSWPRPSSRSKRAFSGLLALLALAMATGAPTVHALAHEASEAHHHPAPESHHDAGSALVGESSSHHGEHPSALHADWLVLRGVDADIDISSALPCVPQVFIPAATELHPPEAVPEAHPSCSTPPAPNAARGPPTV